MVVVVVVVVVVVILVEVERVGRRGGVGRARVQLGGGNGVEMLDMIGVGCGGWVVEVCVPSPLSV